jgi:Fe-S cluster assembly iron-binding protein IscA
MDVAYGPAEGDLVIARGGVQMFLEKEAGALLSNATFDYSDLDGFMITGMPRSSCC